MTQKTRKSQTYRHTPAFILLSLAHQNLYGAAILSNLRKEIPLYNVDSAVIYRSLQELEENKAVESYWETDTSGPARKWYKINAEGLKLLSIFKEDIELRKNIFEYFLNSYNMLSL